MVALIFGQASLEGILPLAIPRKQFLRGLRHDVDRWSREAPNIESPAKGLCIVAKEPYDFDFPVSDPAKRRDCALEVAHSGPCIV